MEKLKILRGTLVLLEEVKSGKIVLAKKKHKVGIGCWCGYGGKIERGETIRKAAVRELGQESGVFALPKDLIPVARIDFHNKHRRKGAYTFRVYVYVLHRWKGRPMESPEMGAPEAFSKDRLPYEEMMAGDRLWLPFALDDYPIIAEVWYGKDQHTLVGKKFIYRTATPAELARF